MILPFTIYHKEILPKLLLQVCNSESAQMEPNLRVHMFPFVHSEVWGRFFRTGWCTPQRLVNMCVGQKVHIFQRRSLTVTLKKTFLTSFFDVTARNLLLNIWPLNILCHILGGKICHSLIVWHTLSWQGQVLAQTLMTPGQKSGTSRALIP